MKYEKKICVICGAKDSKYKCPTCRVPYCSVACCKNHKNSDVCKPPQEEAEIAAPQPSAQMTSYEYPTDDTVPPELLERLGESDKLKALLSNPHLHTILTNINSINSPEAAMEEAMQEPLFMEFADVCMRMVDPSEDEIRLPHQSEHNLTEPKDHTAILHSLLRTALAPFNTE
ncbi:zinc finger HIT domain-containing protein 3 [Cloeon dipterum]|uniref:zinc finger HIT domain-containing protein 3 n=1 Tax=Cloeon dipterum TaxID=197152 RepID=UPI00321FBA0A